MGANQTQNNSNSQSLGIENNRNLYDHPCQESFQNIIKKECFHIEKNLILDYFDEENKYSGTEILVLWKNFLYQKLISYNTKNSDEMDYYQGEIIPSSKWKCPKDLIENISNTINYNESEFKLTKNELNENLVNSKINLPSEGSQESIYPFSWISKYGETNHIKMLRHNLIKKTSRNILNIKFNSEKKFSSLYHNNLMKYYQNTLDKRYISDMKNSYEEIRLLIVSLILQDIQSNSNIFFTLSTIISNMIYNFFEFEFQKIIQLKEILNDKNEVKLNVEDEKLKNLLNKINYKNQDESYLYEEKSVSNSNSKFENEKLKIKEQSSEKAEYIKRLEELYLLIHNTVVYLSLKISATLTFFYGFKQGFLISDKEDISNEIRAALIKGPLYDLIYKIKSELDSVKSNQFKVNLYLLFNITPDKLNLNPFLALDLSLKNDLNKKLFKYSNSNFNNLNSCSEAFSDFQLANMLDEITLERGRYLSQDLLAINSDDEENNKEYDEKDEINHEKIAELKNSIRDSRIMSKISNNFNNKQNGTKITEKHFIPYEKTISLFKAKYHRYNLIKKLQLLIEIRESFNDEIKVFWNKNEKIAKKLDFDTDSTLMLFTYLIIRAKIHQCYLDFIIINDFISEKLKLTKEGYLLSLVLSSNEIINDYLNEKIAIENKHEYNKRLIKEKEFIKNLESN